MIDVSIIVCCYNSEERILPTLKSVIRQELFGLEAEVILINNGSTDRTEKVAKEIWRSYKSNLSFRIVDELKAGLSYARRKGVDVSKGKYIIFCDDDNWLDKSYVINAFKIMEAEDKIGVLGGTGSPVIEGKEPYWFKKYEKYYALGCQAAEDGDITMTKGYVYGAGSVFRKSALTELYTKGFEHFLSDRKGKLILSGGDNELCYNIVFLGYKIYYSSQLQFRHFIPNSRLHLNYLKRFREGQAYSSEIIKCYEQILFSEGRKRRNKIERLKDIKYGITRAIFFFRNRNKIDEADFIFEFYNHFNMVRLTLYNWRSYYQQERQIYQFYEKIRINALDE